MTNNTLDKLFSDMLDSARADYSQTPEGKLLKEKLDKIYYDSIPLFNQDELGYAKEFYSSILEIKTQEMKYIYLKGFQDCTALIRHII